MNKRILFSSYVLLTLLFAACAPLYVKNLRYETFINEGLYEEAESFIDHHAFFKKKRNRLLYVLEKGRLAFLTHEYEKSNAYFNEADRLIEDYRKEFPAEVLSMFTNQDVKPYRAEDFEAVILHYYKAMNYIALRQFDDAMVEVRRVNLRLQQLNDQYRRVKNQYAADAFAHILMGLIYESFGDINNAFIAFRNAADLFLKEGKPGTYFDAPMPEQLQTDLLRTAYANGFTAELRRYEQIFGITYHPRSPPEGGELIFIWENGLGPVKDEWSVNFSIVREGRAMFFVHPAFGWRIPVFFDRDEDRDNFDLQFIRVVFPRYVERPTHYTSAVFLLDKNYYPLELVQPYNEIARQTLKDRFFREAGTALVRLVIKEISERKIKKENKGLGTLVDVLNTITEKADTRNWQTLPAALHYARIPLEKGKNELILELQTCHGQTQREVITVEGNGRLVFMTYPTLFSEPGMVFQQSF